MKFKPKGPKREQSRAARPWSGVQERAVDRATAYHEAGHAVIAYWRFARMNLCGGIELNIGTPDWADESAMAVGGCMVRRMKAGPELRDLHAQFSAAGYAGELICMKVSLKRSRREVERVAAYYRESFAKDWEYLEAEDDPDSFGGDLGHWRKKTLLGDAPTTLEEFLQGFDSARLTLSGELERMVCALARAVFERKSLAPGEVLKICGRDY